jgi:hypothetical protein
MILQTGGPTDFLDPKTIGAFGGSTAAVLAVTVALRRVFRVDTPIVPFALSQIVSFVLAYTGATLKDPLGWLLAFVNGCLLFCAVVGANEGATNVAHPQPAGQGKQQGGKKQFFSSYFHPSP